MISFYLRTVLLIISFLLTTQSHGQEAIELQTLYSEGSSSVSLSNVKSPTKTQLNNHGKKRCQGKPACLIWYFDHRANPLIWLSW